jgi:formylglycine-generating enzyme required for sulfatase activity
VTQQEFEQVLGRNPSYFRPWVTNNLTVFDVGDTSRYPVEQVAWYDAAEFCNGLSRREGLPDYYELQNIIWGDPDLGKGGLMVAAKVSVLGGPGYRLPSDAEWEYACRAGTTTPFHFGSQLDGRRANVDGNYPYGAREKGPHRKRPESVGAYPPNAFGLYDMHGNVWEWCNDYYYPRSQPESPNTMYSGDSRVLRGGCWWRDAADARSASRNGHGPAYRDGVAGFRVARSF